MKHHIEEHRKNGRSSNGSATGKDSARGQNDTKTHPTPAEKDTCYRRCMNAMESNTAISSDDPQVIQKLTERLDTLVHMQIFMMAANQCIETEDKAGFLRLEFGTDNLWTELHSKFGGQEIGYTPNKLTNNIAKINRIWKRIAEFKKNETSQKTEKTVKGVRAIQNSAANRMQLIFPARPSEEVQARLHRVHAFHWFIKDFAWQRRLNPSAIYEAERFLAWYEPNK